MNKFPRPDTPRKPNQTPPPWEPSERIKNVFKKYLEPKLKDDDMEVRPIEKVSQKAPVKTEAATMEVKCEEKNNRPLDTLAAVAMAARKSEEMGDIKTDNVKTEKVETEAAADKPANSKSASDDNAVNVDENDRINKFGEKLNRMNILREKAEVVSFGEEGMNNFMEDLDKEPDNVTSCLDKHSIEGDKEPLQYYPNSPPCETRAMEHARYLLEWGRAYGAMPFGISSTISLACPEPDDHDFLYLKDVRCGHVNNLRFLHVVVPQLVMAMEQEWIFGDGGPDFQDGFFAYLSTFAEYMMHNLDLYRHQAEGVLCGNKCLMECVKNLHKTWLVQRVAKYEMVSGNIVGKLKPLALKATVHSERRWKENYFYVHTSRNKNLTPKGVLVCPYKKG